MAVVCNKLTKESPKNVCLLCNSFAIDEQLYGCMYQRENVIVHHYCVLLSSQMEQNGEDEEGILGFLLPDILKEKKRASKSICHYCHLLGATVLCAHGRCKVKFHVPCGVTNNCLNQFFGAFRSFCTKHRPEQRIPAHIITEAKKAQPTCTICFENVEAKACPSTLWAPCCSRNAWFHRKCIQSLAINAGYFFKCPLCNDKESFQKAMLNFGIYVPQQDASWETVPNAFHELLERHNTCDLPSCKCPKSRKFNSPGTIWEIILCSTCASQGIHIGCGKLKFNTTEWECPECCKTIKKAEASRRLVAAEDSSNSSSDESSSTSRIPRVKTKLVKSKRPKDKIRVKKSRPCIDDSPSSSSSTSSSSPSNASVPDETADIIVISSDDELIEIVDSPKPILSSTHTVTVVTSDVDSSSDIDIVGDFPVNPSAIKRPSEEPTAFIKFHNPSGSGSTVVSASSFRNISSELNSPSSSEGAVQIPGPNPDVIITLNRSDKNQNLSALCDKNFSHEERLQPRPASNFIDCRISTCATASDQFSNPFQTSHNEQKSSNDSLDSATDSWNAQLAPVVPVTDEQQSRCSSPELPLITEGKLLRRYNHLGLKPVRVIIKPLKFLQIGKNRFLTVIPSSKSKKKLGRRANKLRLRIENNEVQVENLDSVSALTKRKLCINTRDPHPLKKFILDACDAQQDQNPLAVPNAHSACSKNCKKPDTLNKKVSKNIGSVSKSKQLSKSSASSAKISATKKNVSPIPKSVSNPKITQKKNSSAVSSVKAGSSKTTNDSMVKESKDVPPDHNANKQSKAQGSGKKNVIENFFRPLKSWSPPNLTKSTVGENVDVLEPKSVKVQPKVSTPQKLKLKTKTPVKDRVVSDFVRLNDSFGEMGTSREKCDSPKSNRLKSESDIKKTGGDWASNKKPAASSPASSKKLESQNSNDVKSDSPKSNKLQFKESNGIKCNSPNLNRRESLRCNDTKFDALKSKKLESLSSNDSKSDFSKSMKLEFQENNDIKLDSPHKENIGAKTDELSRRKTSEINSKPELRSSEKGSLGSLASSRTPVGDKLNKKSPNLKLKSPKGKVSLKFSEQEIVPRSKGKLIPISLFDGPADSEENGLERMSNQKLMSKNSDVTKIKLRSEVASKSSNLKSRKSTGRNKSPESRSSSLSKSFDRVDAVSKDEALSSKEKHEKAHNQLGVVDSSADKSSKRSKAIHPSLVSKESKSSLKRESSKLNHPSTSKKIRQEAYSGLDSSKEDTIIPLFEFELMATPKLNKNEKIRRNSKNNERSVKTLATPSISDPPQSVSEEGKVNASSKDETKKLNTTQDESKSARSFPKIISLSAEKDLKASLSNPNTKEGVKERPDIPKKVSPPINKFFPVLERPSSTTNEKSNRSKVEKTSNCLTDTSSTNGIKPPTAENEFTPKSIAKLKTPAQNSSRTTKERRRDSKENIATFKTYLKSSEKSLQTRITDYCSKNNSNVASSMPLQPSKKFV